MLNNESDNKRYYNLNEEDIEIISERIILKIQDSLVEEVSTQLENRFLQGIGRVFVNKILQILGLTIVGLFLYLNGKGFLHIN